MKKKSNYKSLDRHKEKPIYITEPSLPPLEKFLSYLEEIWDSKILTNNGPFHHQFEKELADYLEVPYVSLVSNGTLALIVALQALHITGDVITTPYSFVATAHSLWWNNIKPVFVDIEPDFCNLDPDKIESAITPQATAIMPVHVYGNPCNVERIQKIADTYGLKVIYDAAHCFGVKYKGQSICNYGDLSILSFHATKVFNTFEGGAIISHDEKMKQRIDYLKNFGFIDEASVIEPGINAKMNEFQAALGLLQLKYVDETIKKRKEIAGVYRERLSWVKGIRFLSDIKGVRHNYCYFPIFVDAKKYGMTRDQLYEKLKKNNIYCRKYFYPLITDFFPYRSMDSARPDNLPLAERTASQVICLPIYSDLANDRISKIVEIIANGQHKI
ncbi:MAG TPA: aminotransferase [Bacteroidales bacterium]|nr:aminotransferase [Bacteroidales bacterium]